MRTTERFPYGDLVQKLHALRVRTGDVLVLPAEVEIEQVEAFRKALSCVMAGPCFIAVGDVQKLDEAEMNALGWHRGLDEAEMNALGWYRA